MENQRDRRRREVNTMYWERMAREISKPFSEGLGEVVIHPKIQERIDRCLKNYHREKPSR